MRRSIGLAIATIAALALGSVPARAQVPSLKIEFTPWAGVYAPATDLAESGGGLTAPVSIKSSVAFGGNLGLRLPMGVGIEAQVGYAPAEVEYETGGTPQTADLNVLFAAANLQWRFGPPLIPLKPYVTGGLGFVRWESDAFTALGAEESVTNLAGNIGAGAYLSVGPIVKLRAEGRAYLTTASADDFGSTTDESKFQSHFVASAGLVFEFGL